MARLPMNHSVRAIVGLLFLLPALLGAAETPQPVRVEVKPALVTLVPGQRQHFQAHAFSADGRDLPFAARWNTEAGASISASGLFVAERPGRYTVTASTEGGRVVGTAVAIVQAPRAPVGELLIRPREVRLARGDTAQFQALLLDRDGNPREAQLLWQARGGTIDQNGLFTAGNHPGRYRITVQDRGSRLEADAVVEIVASP